RTTARPRKPWWIRLAYPVRISCVRREISGRARGSATVAWRAATLLHVLGQDLGEAVQALLGRQLTDHRLLEERHALGVELAAPPRVGEVGTDDREVLVVLPVLHLAGEGLEGAHPL